MKVIVHRFLCFNFSGIELLYLYPSDDVLNFHRRILIKQIVALYYLYILIVALYFHTLYVF